MNAKTTTALAITIFSTSLFGFFYRPHPALRFGLAPDLVWSKYGVPLFSCMFFHATWLHLFGNLAFLYAYGSLVETKESPWRMIRIFFVSGISGSLLYVLCNPNETQAATGTSAGVAGLLTYGFLRWPKEKIFFLPVWAGFIFAILIQMTGVTLYLLNLNRLSLAAHTGGAISGILFYLQYKCYIKNLDVPPKNSGPL